MVNVQWSIINGQCSRLKVKGSRFKVKGVIRPRPKGHPLYLRGGAVGGIAK